MVQLVETKTTDLPNVQSRLLACYFKIASIFSALEIEFLNQSIFITQNTKVTALRNSN